MAKLKKQTDQSKTPAVSAKRAAVAQTRKEHAEETAQDYVELIAQLICEKGEARAIDLSRRLAISHVTVGKTLRRLERLNLLKAPPYASIFLTAAGKKLAKESKERHEIVLNFLLALGIPAAIAESDSEGIEHHVSRETLAALKKFTS